MLEGGDNISTSVIIRCKNEERWIGHAIQSVFDHLDNPEVIIADNCSSDDSLDIVRMFQTFLNVSVLTFEQYSPGAVLNKSISQCSYENVLVLSSHCVISKYDEIKIQNNFDNGYVCVFGNQFPVYRGKKLLKRYVWSHFVDVPCKNMWSTIENRYFLHNAFATYKKSSIVENKFDEYLYGKEDRYWAEKVIKQKMNILYDPEMQCNHHWTTNGATWKGIG